MSVRGGRAAAGVGDARPARVRAAAVAALAALTLAAGCARLGGRRSPTGVASTPAARTDSGRTAARDSARGDSARAAAGDSTRRDSTARGDSVRAGADSGATPARRPRRQQQDPSRRCGVVNFNDNPVTARVTATSDGLGNYITYVGGGAVARCEGVNSVLRADSAENFESLGQVVLIGNVSYDEPRRVRMTSMRMTYFTRDERLVAEGNVVVTLPSGTTLTGPNVEYLRDIPRLRPTSRMVAIGRPVVRAVGTGGVQGPGGRPARGADTSVTTIVANTIVNEADSAVYASGQVEIARTDVTANSDSAVFDQTTEIARLLRNARIVGRGQRSFTMTGARIDLFSRERTLTRVQARDSARIVSEDLNLRSDTVDLRLREGQVERAFAWGPSRAVATSPERDVVADSIDARLPDQRIRELRAFRKAVARSVPDSTKITSDERDLLAGDTIRAVFDSVAAARDTTRNPPVRQIVAAGNAASLFQVASQQGRTAPPSINYVKGRRITVDFDSGQVQLVTVLDQATGVYLEPGADSTARDSTGRALPGAVPGAPATPVTPVTPAGTPTPSPTPAGTPTPSPTPAGTPTPSPTAPRPAAGAPPALPPRPPGELR